MSCGGDALDADRLRGLLVELSERLSERGASVQMFIVGGAAMALEYDGGRMTRDVDAVFAPTDDVRQIVSQMGDKHGLERDWINDAVKGYLPGTDSSPVTVFESASLLVQVPSPEYLLAMKVHASRDDRDLDDAARLFAVAGLSSPKDVVELLLRTYPSTLLLPRHRYLAHEVAERASRFATPKQEDHRVHVPRRRVGPEPHESSSGDDRGPQRRL